MIDFLKSLVISRNFWYQVLIFLLFLELSVSLVWNNLAVAQNETSRVFPFFFQVPIVIIIGFLISRLVTWRFVVRFVCGYVFYLIASYWMTMTLSLNNKDFHWESFKSFWQMNFLLEAMVMMVVAYGFQYFITLGWDRERFSLEVSRVNRRVVLSGMLSSVYVTGKVFLDRLQSNHLLPIGKRVSESQQIWSVIQYVSTFFVLFFCINYLCLKAFHHLKSNRPSLSLALSSCLLVATVANYFIQAGITDKGKNYDYYTAPGATIFQIIILTLSFFVIFLIINRYLTSLVLVSLLAIIIAVVNQAKYALRQEPFLPSDLIWIREISFFKAYVSTEIIVAIVVGGGVIIGLLFLARGRVLPGAIVGKWRERLSVVMIMLLVSITSIRYISSHDEGSFPKGVPVLSSLYNLYDISWRGINAKANYQSLSYVWVNSLTTKKMATPKDYNRTKIKEIYDKYKKIATDLNKTRQQKLSDQTVIYILSESLANPTRLTGISASANPLEYITQVENESTGGLMLSDGYGGGTANMEFQSLTGLPMTNFKSGVSVLYSDVFPDMSYVPTLSQQYNAKNRIAIHLASAANYNRKLVYSRLNFGTFVALSGTKDKPTDTDIFGLQYSDAATYQNILDKLDSNQNQFFSVMTMQNHSPYLANVGDTISISGQGFNESRNHQLHNYTNLIVETDKATQAFLDKLKNYPKKVTVVFYGDHLPGIYPENFFVANPESQYLTDYFIWSNYEAPKLNYPKIRSNDFPALLLEETNSKVSPYYALLTKALPDRQNERDKETQEDLKLIQYDITTGKNYVSKYEDFFTSSK
ncbi:LTA synthase family protein [Streptococcus sciuri]|nr:LTA synthase family protein [Streptococcus sciuri]